MWGNELGDSWVNFWSGFTFRMVPPSDEIDWYFFTGNQVMCKWIIWCGVDLFVWLCWFLWGPQWMSLWWLGLHYLVKQTIWKKYAIEWTQMKYGKWSQSTSWSTVNSWIIKCCVLYSWQTWNDDENDPTLVARWGGGILVKRSLDWDLMQNWW